MLNSLHGGTFYFHGSLLGFGGCDRFQFQTVDEEGVYGYLQSEEDEAVGFVVVNPFLFYSDYGFEIEEQAKEALKLESHEDAVILTIVTVQEPFDQSTVNLLAPLVINLKTSQGRQLVLPPKQGSLGTREPLFRHVRAIREE
ncbi:flagellar assembly protein FliW [Paenibacillus sp. y28]|uniref:flagellar assembly protein FliW n=1 Tax=Paenibacillus sp. y28 TaxID=3129110 RepID=UPI00301A1638